MRRILCVDDHVDSCELVKYILGSFRPDLCVDLADSSEQAIEMISSESYDLYLLDLWMPGIDGAELCRWIRDSGSTNPVVFVSGAVTQADKAGARRAGGSDFLGKPFEPDDLVRVVTAYLPVVVAEQPNSKWRPLGNPCLAKLAA